MPYGGPPLVSRSIGEALPNRATQRPLCPVKIVHAKGNAVGVAEIKLTQISVQMLLSAMLVNALHAAFEDRIVAFHSVGGDVAANIFLGAVVDGIVAQEVRPELLVPSPFIGHDDAFALDVIANYLGHFVEGSSIDMEAAGRTAALDKGKDDVLVRAASALLGYALKAADVGFVGLHGLASATHGLKAGRAHRLTDTMGNEPRSFEGATKGAVKLIAADPLLAAGHEEDRLQPVPHGDVARLEDSPDLHGKGLAALVALVSADPGGFTPHLGDALDPTAMRADWPVRPNASFYKGIGSFFVVEVLG